MYSISLIKTINNLDTFNRYMSVYNVSDIIYETLSHYLSITFNVDITSQLTEILDFIYVYPTDSIISIVKRRVIIRSETISLTSLLSLSLSSFSVVNTWLYPGYIADNLFHKVNFIVSGNCVLTLTDITNNIELGTVSNTNSVMNIVTMDITDLPSEQAILQFNCKVYSGTTNLNFVEVLYY